MTHALGIGMSGPAAKEEFDRMEAFFRERGSAVPIDLCPLADASLLEMIFSRGYRVIEFNNVMIRRILAEEPAPVRDCLTVSVACGRELDTWNRTVARGFQERDEIDDSFVEMLAGTSLFGQCYIARRGRMRWQAAACRSRAASRICSAMPRFWRRAGAGRNRR